MLLTLLTPLSDYVDQEGLAMLAKCSKGAHSLAAPLLELQMRDKEKVRCLLLRLFPAIVGLPVDKEAAYYRALLDGYFSSVFSGAPATQAEVSVALGQSIGRPMCTRGLREVTLDLLPAMQRARGRKMIRVAIRDLREALMLRDMDHRTQAKLCVLSLLEHAVQTDLCVRLGRIDSRHNLSLMPM